MSCDHAGPIRTPIIALPKRSTTASLDAHAWRQPLKDHIAPEAIEPRWSAARAQAVLSRGLDQSTALHEAAEILLVQMRTEDGLHRLLQLKQGEHLRHQLEDDGLAFQAAAQLTDGACEHARMVAEHWMGEPWHQPPHRSRLDRLSAVPCQTRLAQKLVALEHLLLVPRRPVAAKGNAQAPAALQAVVIRVICTILEGNRGPGLEAGLDHLAQALGFAAPPILPGKIRIPALPSSIARLPAVLGTDRGQVADGDDRWILPRKIFLRAFTERANLAGYPQLDARLLPHPKAQAR